MFSWLKLLKFDVTKTENSYNKVVYYLIISDVNIVSCVFFYVFFFLQRNGSATQEGVITVR